MYLQFSSVSYHKKVSFIMFSTCSQSSIFQIHLCYFTLCQFFCQFMLILLYINGVCPFAFCGLVLASRGLFIPLASRGLAFEQPAPLLRACCPNILMTDRSGAGFGTFKAQNRGNQPTNPTSQRKRAHTGSFSQIVSILGEVKLVNIYIRHSWHLGSH